MVKVKILVVMAVVSVLAGCSDPVSPVQSDSQEPMQVSDDGRGTNTASEDSTHDSSHDFSDLFGKQGPVRLVSSKYYKNYDIKVEVIRGDKLKLVPSRNYVVGLKNQKLGSLGKPQISPDRLYVYCKMKLKAEFGHRIYTCDVRISSGELEGAIVHIGDHMCPESIIDPYQSIYLLPKDLVADEGKVDIEVVDWWQK